MKYRLFRYEVKGGGAFPFDMLRYDAGWPTSQKDTSKLLGHDRRTVEISGIHTPTRDRWASFGWTIMGKVESRTVEQLST